jgi:3D (Asp-Asp-Asp) domain-containing protein
MTAHHNKVQKYNLIKYTVAGIFLLLCCTFITLYLFENNMSDVRMTLNGTVYAKRTINTTVGEFIEDNNIPFNDAHDYIDVSLDETLNPESRTSFVIKNAVPVTLIHDGIETEVMTYKGSIIEVLEENGVMLYEYDRIDKYNPDTEVVGGMTIKVVRVTTDVEVTRSPIPYKIKVVENPTMAVNERNTLAYGEYGEHGLVIKVTYEDGVEISRETTLNKVIKPVVHEVIEVGTIPIKTIQGTNETFMYSKVMTMKATAYTLDPAETGGKEPGHPAYGITKSGLPVEHGIIAVDPDIIPLFTRVYIETADGTWLDYGMAVAADTGSAIQGNIIDLFMWEKADALRWGRRTVRVYFVYEK